KQRTLESWFGR
nr:Chain B, C-terminus of FEN-1 protein [Thermococcus kodakarensis KOD1]